MNNKRLRLGVVSANNKNPIISISVRMLERNIFQILKDRFHPCYFFVDSCDNFNRQQAAFNKFVSSCDLVFELLVNIFFEPLDKKVPIVFFPLAFMEDPFYALAKLGKRLRLGNYLLFSSRADLEIFNNLFGKNARRMTYLLAWPIDINEFKPQGIRENKAIREKLGIPQNCPLLVYAGRINIQKNIHTLLKIFKEVLKIFPQARLCIAGEEDDDPFEEFDIENKGYTRYLRKKCSEYKIVDNVVFLGQLERKELIGLYSAADVLLNCTIYNRENFGYSQIEAMACATPVICSQWGGLKDTVIHGKTGYHIPTILTNNGVKVDWQKGLKFLTTLLSNKKKLIQMSRESRRHIQDNFSFDRIANILEDVFLDILRQKKEKLSFQNLIKIKKRDSQFINLFIEYLYYNRARQKVAREKPFFKQNYNYYKFLTAAYSSTFASEIFRRDSSLVPYFLQDTSIRQRPSRMYINDPIWPQKHRVKKWEFKALRMIDGNKSIREIHFNLKKENSELGVTSLLGLCKRLSKDGVLSFINNNKSR